MVTAYKAVAPDFSSCRVGGPGMTAPEELIALALDYTVGNTVTPDPDAETAFKLASADGLMRSHVLPWTHQPHGSNGIYAWVGDFALEWAKGAAAFLLNLRPFLSYGHVVTLDYEDGDVIDDLGVWGLDPSGGITTLLLRSCTVAEQIIQYSIVSDIDGKSWAIADTFERALDVEAELNVLFPELNGHLSIVTV